MDELGAAEQYIGISIVQLVIESKKKAAEVAQNLIAKPQQELTDTVIQQQSIELVETIGLYKFPNLSREELEAMLGPV